MSNLASTTDKISYQVFSFGSNGCGQLGVGHEEDLIVPQISFESKIKPKKISCGGNHSMLLLEDGSLYWCGDNHNGQCLSGLTSSSDWQLVSGKYSDVACGWEYTLVIDIDGKVKIVGHGRKSELGTLHTTKSSKWISLMDCTSANAKCYSSFQNCLVQDGNKIYGWGPNRKKQLLDNDLKRIETPQIIYHGKDIRAVEMGKDFTAILDGNDLVVRGSINEATLEEVKSNFGTIKQIYCMWSSLHVLTESNDLIGIGNSSYGQILSESLPHDVQMLAVGSEHGILTTSSHQVYCWGWGEHGNCGRINRSKDPINDKSNVISPLNNIGYYPNVIHISAGCASSWIILRQCSTTE